MHNQKWIYEVYIKKTDDNPVYYGLTNLNKARAMCTKAIKEHKVNYAFVRRESIKGKQIDFICVFKTGFRKKMLTREECREIGTQHPEECNNNKPFVRVKNYGKCYICGSEVTEKPRAVVISGRLCKICENCREGK